MISSGSEERRMDETNIEKFVWQDHIAERPNNYPEMPNCVTFWVQNTLTYNAFHLVLPISGP